MIEVAAFAFVVCVAFVVIGKSASMDHHADAKAWKHIRDHDRVYFMTRGHSK